MRHLSIFALFLTIYSCNNYSSENIILSGKLDSLQSENKKLRSQITSLSEVVTIYKIDPNKLLKNAEDCYKVGDYAELTRIQKIFTDYHPENINRPIVDGYISKLYEKKKRDEADAIKLAKQEEDKRLKAVTKLEKKHDDVSGITWYENPYFTHYTNSNMASIYIGQSATKVWLLLRMSYYGDNWIFFEKAYLSYDGNTKEILFDRYKDKKTENV